MPVMTLIHLGAALTALLAGALQLALPKGGGRHRRLGWLWLLAMLVTAITSFWLSGLTHYRFSGAHLLSLWVLFCLYAAVRHARQGQISAHRYFVLGANAGLLIAGAAALLTPGRLLNLWWPVLAGRLFA